VIFSSVNYDEEESPKMLAQAYYDVTGKRFPGVIIGTNFDKTEAISALAEIPGKIGKVLGDEKLFAAILWAESILNQGADGTLSMFTREEFESAVKALLKSIIDDTGAESVTREFVMVIARLLTRNLASAKGYTELKELLEGLRTSGSIVASPTEESIIYNRRMYYVPDSAEPPWTGDIYRTDSADPKRKFAILITPSCDISQEKVGYFKVAYGVVATDTELRTNPGHPLFKMDKSLGSDSTKAIEKYLHKKGSIPPRLYPLNHFLDESNDQSRTLIVDFQAIDSLTPEALFGNLAKTQGQSEPKWARPYRLDSPFIEDLLQKYGAHSFRLGTPTVTR
jgi:hypothetical protein